MKMMSSMTASIAILLLTEGLVASDRVGVQAVVFPRWSPQSVSNMVSVINEVRPAEFELSQCPFFGDSTRWYRNTTLFLRDINPQTKVAATFFLSFHTDQQHSLAQRAGDLNSYLLAVNPDLRFRKPMDRIQWLILSPQLEDEYSDEVWTAKMTECLHKLDLSIITSGKLNLRRSIYRHESNLRELKYVRNGKIYPLSIRVERHGASSTSAGGVWSNDGSFVFHELTLDGVREDSSSIRDSKTSGMKVTSLDSFISTSKTRTGVTTLWRPAYNIWRRDINGGRVSWARDSSVPEAWNRRDAAVTFDDREQRVLRRFLRGVN